MSDIRVVPGQTLAMSVSASRAREWRHSRDARNDRVVRARRAMTSTARALDASASATRKKRMLALHGKGGNAASFARHLAPLVERTSTAWEWHFAEGAFVEPNPGGRGWWALRPGERTYSAAELPGASDSVRLVRESGPWDGVFGFSQGAMLAALVCGEDDACVAECAVLVGSAWPTCVAQNLECMERRERSDVSARSLHVIGATDAINPPEQARRVAKAFGARAEVFQHKGGHVVPLDETAMNEYVRFMMLES